MFSTILISLAFIALSVLISYKISASFWKTDYSKTDTSGDFGSPRGGFFATLGGTIISLFLLVYIRKYVIEASAFGYVLGACMLASVIAGFVPLFQIKPKK